MIRSNRRRKPGRKAASVRRIMRGLLQGLALSALASLMVTGGWWLNRALTVQTWQIHGVPEILEVAIEKELKGQEPLDLVHAWPSRLRIHLLGAIPDLAEVNIVRQLPDRLEISATMRMPVGLWRNSKGTVQLVDGQGLAYRPLKAGEMLDLPLLRVSAEELGESVALMLKLKQEDETRYARLSEWIGEGDAWKLNFERGRSWLLPRGSLAGDRMEQVIALMQGPRWKNGDWRIDVRADNRWFIRKSKLGGMV